MMEQFITVADSVQLWIETQGIRKNEACLFINGAGANSSFWSQELCNTLVEKGFYIIRYDHRDFGYSGKVDFEKDPFDVMDLARDAITILDKLGVSKAHVIGHSMGGFIAQLLAIHCILPILLATIHYIYSHLTPIILLGCRIPVNLKYKNSKQWKP